MKRLVLLLLLLTIPLSAAKQRDWKDAKLTNIGSSDGGVVVMPIGTGLYGGHIQRSTYTFETSELLIYASDSHPRALNLTMNKVLKVAIDAKHLYVIDDSGKEIKLNIGAKRAK